MLTGLGKEFENQMVIEGVYIAEFEYNFNHEMSMKDIKLKNQYSYEPIVNEEDRYVSTYGVCDDYQQILKLAPEIISSDKKYVIGLTLVKKEFEPYNGGWRWHKWGEYIGMQEPQCEYIFDEPTIEQVYCYHIYEIK